MNSVKVLSLAGMQNPQKVLYAFKLLISLGIKLLQADEGSLLIFNKEKRELQFAATVGNEVNEILIGKTVPVGKGITGMAALTGEIQTASRANGGDFFAVQDDGTPNSVIAAPIMIEDELIGVITAVSFDYNKIFSTADCQNFSLLTQLGAVLITQEQALANCATEAMNNLTQQEEMEMEAAQKVVSWVQKNPQKTETILKLLSLLCELK